MYKVFLNDYYDITNLVLELPNIKESLITETSDLEYKASFKIKNQSEWLSKDYENSIVSNTPVTFYKLYIRDNNQLIYQGTINNIIEQPDKSCTVNCKTISDNLTKELTRSLPNLTLLDIIIQITQEFELDYDHYSWLNIDSLFNFTTFNITATESSPLTLIDLLKEMSESLGIWIYLKNNIIFCAPFVSFEDGYKFSLASSDILDAEIENSFDELRTNYNIKYGVDSVVLDTNNGNIGKLARNIYGDKPIELDATYSSNLTIKDETTAVQVGNWYLERYKDVFDIITFTVKRDLANLIDLLDVMKIEKFDKRYVILDKEWNLNMNTVKLLAWEVVS